MAWKTGDKVGENGKYTIEKRLGSGRFAITYLAYYTQGEGKRKGQRVVIKTIKDDWLEEHTAEQRQELNEKLNKEAMKLSSIKHPHIVRLLETSIFYRSYSDAEGKQQPIICLPLEYIAGVDLDSLAQRHLPEKKALSYIRQIGSALIAIHQQDLLHLDVKPDNILVRLDNHKAVLIGFEFAREIGDPVHMASRKLQKKNEYAAPEWDEEKQQELTKSSDVYSLAATLYRLLTGEKPPTAQQRKASEDIRNKLKEFEVSKPVRDAINSAMEVEPDSRTETVQAFLTELGMGRYSIPLDILADPRWQGVAALIGAATLFVTAMLGFMTLKNSPVSPELEPTTNQLKIKN